MSLLCRVHEMTLPSWLTYLDVLHDMDICIQCEVQIDGETTNYIVKETKYEFLGETKTINYPSARNRFCSKCQQLSPIFSDKSGWKTHVNK